MAYLDKSTVEVAFATLARMGWKYMMNTTNATMRARTPAARSAQIRMIESRHVESAGETDRTLGSYDDVSTLYAS